MQDTAGEVGGVLLLTPSHGRAKAGRPGRTYIQQLCEDTGCSSEDLPKAMNDRERWRERVRDISADGVLWGVAARTCSRLLAAFLCNCRLASSPTVLLESM